jgi:hypothetical protein
MADVGDRVEFLSKSGSRAGVVRRVSGTLVTVEWDTGGQTTVIPAPGVMRVVGRGRGPAKKRPPAKKAPTKKAPTKKAPAKKKAAAKKAPAKKQAAAKKAATHRCGVRRWCGRPGCRPSGRGHPPLRRADHHPAGR